MTPTQGPGGPEGPESVVAPTRVDPVARALSEVAGGPVGRHARPHRWWSPVRVVLALVAVVMGLSIVHHVPCLDTGWAVDQARYGKGCYSDVPYLYTGRGLAEGVWPYTSGEGEETGGRHRTMEYPVGISYLAWGAARLTQLVATDGPSLAERRQVDPASVWGLPGMSTETNSYFLLSAVLLAMCALGAAWFLAGVDRRRPWDALLFALSPALLATALINWDLLAVLFVAGALWAWARDRPGLTGVMIGLGTASKLFPLFLLGPLLVLCLRRGADGRRDLRPFGSALLGAVVSWVVVNAPAYASSPERWKVFWVFNADRGADLGSVWLALTHAGLSFTPDTINTWSWVLFGTTCLAVAVLGLVAPEPPRLAQLGFLVVVGFLLVNKVYSPQYVLWLLPLAVLARPRWRDQLAWQACEVFYVAMVWAYLAGYLDGAVEGTAPTYDVAIWVRVVGQLGLAALVVRDVLRPVHDPVRQDAVVDPGPRGQLISTRSNEVAV